MLSKAARISIAALLSILLWAVSFGVADRSAAGGDMSAVADFAATDLVIFSADGQKVIGYGRYSISASEGVETLLGENKYLDGERDTELDRLKPGPRGHAPTLLGYERYFFNNDQSLRRVITFNVKDGAASCKSYENGTSDERRANLNVPADTYAGVTQMMFIVMRLRQGAENITFHSFNCAPSPQIIPARVFVGRNRERWSMYPGELVKLEIRPDLNWLDFLVAPFLQRMYAYCDPRDNWNYVGGVYDRFYGGPRILTVRTRGPLQGE